MRLAVFALCLPIIAPAADWTRFRGPNGSGLSPETALPGKLDPAQAAWKVPVPRGHSSPIVSGGHVYLTAHEGDERIVLCFDARTGAQVWRRAVTKARTEPPNPLNGITTPTPSTNGSAVFVFFPDFGLIAYDTAGKELWRVLLGPFGGIQGMAGSPIYVDGNVVLLIDTPEQAYLAAWNAATGKQVWKTERPLGWLGSYTTPVLYKPVNGAEQIIVSGAVQLAGYDAKTGERIWWARTVTVGPAASALIDKDSVFTIEPATGEAQAFEPMLAQYDKNKDGKIQIAQELSGDSTAAHIMTRLFTSIDKLSGNNDGVVTAEEWNQAFNPKTASGGLVRTRLGGKGDVSATNIEWRYTKGIPYVLAPVLYQGILYVIRSGGILATLDPATGKLLGEARLKGALGEYYAQPVAADGKVYFINKEGKVSVITAGEKWEMLSSSDLAEDVIATPAIADSRIYVRTETALYCFAKSA